MDLTCLLLSNPTLVVLVTLTPGFGRLLAVANLVAAASFTALPPRFTSFFAGELVSVAAFVGRASAF
ncbi:hypothetical protein GCM10008949_51270 [Deinococcus humi]|nr:hypothetical protein GCM10008949_51270 [Deinococcus humi]